MSLVRANTEHICLKLHDISDSSLYQRVDVILKQGIPRSHPCHGLSKIAVTTALCLRSVFQSYLAGSLLPKIIPYILPQAMKKFICFENSDVSDSDILPRYYNHKDLMLYLYFGQEAEPSVLTLLTKYLSSTDSNQDINQGFTLTTAACKNLLDMIKPNSLVDLTTLYLTWSKVNNAQLAAVVRVAPNLKSLILQECFELKSGFISGCEAENLKNLEVVVLQGTTTSSRDLEFLVKAAFNLKNADLSDTPIFQDNLVLEPDSLLQLTHIDLRATDVKIEHFLMICQAAKNLEIVGLMMCHSLNEGDFTQLPENSLPHLKSIDLSGTNVHSKDDRQALIKAAPNLDMPFLCY